jgi:hypothetical protein
MLISSWMSYINPFMYLDNFLIIAFPMTFLDVLLVEFFSVFFHCHQLLSQVLHPPKQSNLVISGDEFRLHIRDNPQPAGQKVHVHRIFSLTLARRAFANGSSISLSGNLHPQLTSRNSPLYFGRSDFTLSRIQWSSALSLNL